MTRTFARATRATLIAAMALTAFLMTAGPASAGTTCGSGTADGDFCYTDDGVNATKVCVTPLK